MKVVKLLQSPESYALAEKIAKASGFKSVSAWVTFLIREKVGHTSLAKKR